MDSEITKAVGFNTKYEAEKKDKFAKIEVLRSEYIALYTGRDDMYTNRRDDIYCRYVRLLGRAKYENFKLMVEVRTLKMKVELAQAALNRNQRPDLAAIEAEARSRLADYFERLDEQARAVQAAEKARGVSLFVVKELKELFRVLVKRLHPDLHPDLPEKLKDLFIKGQVAYRSYDIDLLREIVKRLDLEDATALPADESLDDTISRLSRDVEALRQDIEDLRLSFPFNIEADLLDPVWVERQQKAVAEEREKLRSLRDMYADRLDLLT